MSASKEFIAKQAKVASDSEEWGSLEYYLQMCLGTPAAVVKQIWSVASPHLLTAFEKRCQGKTSVDCWLDTSVLSFENKTDKICSSGFDTEGLVFTNGTIRLSDISYDTVYEFLLVKVGVGASHPMKLEEIDTHRFSVPKGYDSIYIVNSDDEPTFSHSYIIQDPSQAVASYLVHFKIDPKLEAAAQETLCDICQETPASVYCESDDAHLCYECDYEHHTRGNKLMQKHRRVEIIEKSKSFGNCLSHPDSKVEFYCATCQLPICINCKMIGSHATPETHSHTFYRIGEAYARAMKEANETDPVLEQRKFQLNSLVKHFQEKLESINKNAEEVEAKIYKILQTALAQLHEETLRKKTSVMSAEYELKKQLEEIEWSEAFLKYQQQVLSPSYFMFNWGRHSNVRQKLCNMNEPPSNGESDIRLEGNILVTAENREPVESVVTSNPKAPTSKFRAQLFNRYQDNPLSLLKSMIPSKPMDALKFTPIRPSDD